MRQPYLGDFRITKLYGTPPPKGVKYSTGRHSGIDLVGVDDKLVRAVLGGTVFRAGFDPDGWGKYIVVKQTDGLFAIYCHLSKAHKATNQTVKEGEWIGNEGATGQVTGAHLHFELRKNYNDKYSTIDPAEYLGLVPEVGIAKAVSDVQETKVKLNLFGEKKTVDGWNDNGHLVVRVKDLDCEKLAVGWQNGEVTVTAK